jgi:signal transduction histidine kinase
MKLVDAQPAGKGREGLRRHPASSGRTRRPREQAVTRAVCEEREATARWLHDRTLQMLEYLAMGGYGIADPEDLQELARTAADDLRSFIDGARAGEQADLAAALAEAVCATQLIAGGLCIQLVPGPVEETPDAEQVAELAAAVREALCNVVRHAGADLATVAYGVADGWAWVEVRDDGIGFDPATTRFGQGLRHSIVGRVVRAGGCARVEPSELGGTVVHMRVPARRWRPEAVCA